MRHPFRSGGIVVAVVIGAGALLWTSPASAVLPPSYDPVPGTVPLNPAQVGAVGREFSQDCNGLPRPVQPGEVAWHFILPQSVLLLNGPLPVKVFDTLDVTFQSAGLVSLTSGFGPPSAARAYIYTATDDSLLAGSSTIGRRPTALPQFGNDPRFNLSHTCASTSPPTTTTTTTAPSATTTPDATTVPADVAGESIVNDPNGESGQTTLPRTGGSVPVLPLVVAIAATLAGIALLAAPRQRRSRG
jgi:hypothetical protein